MTHNDIITFWFDEIAPKQWWEKSDAFDVQIKERFSATHKAAAAGELWRWRASAQGRLAEIIVLDQFSRNMYRDTQQAFAYDGLALALAQHAVQLGIDRGLSTSEKAFLYLPYMHSESLEIHEEAVRLYSLDEGLAFNLDFEHKHKVIIEKFGRYPHRNAILGRVSTPEEVSFLQEPGSSF